VKANSANEFLALPSPAEHAGWLRAKRRQLTRLLGGFPSKGALNAETVRREEKDDRVIECISYEAEPGDVVNAVLMVPRRRTPPMPAVLCHHQHAGQFDLGKSEVVGWAGNPQQAYAAELCSRGYVTFAPDAVGFEERAHPHLSGPDYERYLHYELLLKGMTLQGKYVWDVMQALDYLRSRPEVDKDRVGMIGHSLGAVETLFSAALAPNIKAAAASCGTTTYADVLKVEAVHNPGYYVPNMLTWGDFPEVVSMIAPRPLLVMNGEKDWRFPLSGAKDVVARAGMFYRRLGAPEGIELFASPEGHEFTGEMRKRAYHWFDRWL
jgi:dienelactone hydrolase